MNSQTLEEAMDTLSEWRMAEQDALMAMARRIMLGEMVQDRQIANAFRDMVEAALDEAEYTIANETIDPEEYNQFIAADALNRAREFNED